MTSRNDITTCMIACPVEMSNFMCYFNSFQAKRSNLVFLNGFINKLSHFFVSVVIWIERDSQFMYSNKESITTNID